MRKWMAIVVGLVSAALSMAAAPRPAEAFCGFYVAPGDKPLYNDASMVVLMRDGTRTVMSMSNNYKGPAADFAMVVPVPVVLQKENVKTLNKATFTRLESLSAPRLVEYWEQDPCSPYGEDTPKSLAPSMAKKPSAAGAGAEKKDYGVKIEAQFEVGEYQILILSAKESDGLESWLHDNKYNIPKGASSALAPYIKEQQKFFVAKVDSKKVQIDAQGVAVLSPLRFSYESQDFRLPVRLGLLNAKAKQDLLVFVLSKQSRYEVANYPNVFIPTNLEVSDDTRKAFAPFYAALFDEAVSKGHGKGIVTEYAWSTPFFPTGGGMKCDPCPSQPLTNNNDLAALGGDVLFGMAPAPPPGLPGIGTTPPPPPQPAGPPGGAKKKPMPMPGTWFGGMNVVITRLHARYDQNSLSDDLIFKTADAVVGGREHVTGAKGEIEQGAQSSTVNNFQARYIIRHKWAGAIKCKDPKRGIWGGPPGSQGGPPPPAPATNLAAAIRGEIKLTAYLKAGLPTFEVKMPGPLPIAPPAATGSGDVDAGPPEDAGAASTSPSSSSLPPDPAGSATVAPVPPRRSGCGCRVGETSPLGIGAAAGGVSVVAALARRRRRR